MLALADTKAGSVPIVLLPISLRIFIVKICLNFKIFPHLKEIKCMLTVIAVRTELVFDLEHDDVASVYFQEGFDHFGQGCEVDEHLVFIEFV